MSARVAAAVVATGMLLTARLSPIAAQKGGGGDQHSSDFAIGVRGGTLGIGVELSKLLVPHVGLRAGGNFLSLSQTGRTLGDSKYDITADFKSFDALLDLYPSPRGSFHLTGGLITSPLKVTGTNATGATSYTFNGNNYTSAQVGTLSLGAKFPSAAPYVGLGFGTPASKHGGLAFVFDLGIGIGKPTLTLTSTNAGSNPTLKADMDAEIAKRQKDADKIPGYPVLSVGFIYRF